MISRSHIYAVLFLLFICTLISCDKIERGSGENNQETSDELIVKKSFDICIPGQVIDSRTVDGHLFEVHAPEVKASEAFELYLKIFPLYVFGNSYAAGDYYCVEGYMLSRNAKLYAERADRDVKINGWYPEEYALDFELLSPEGKSLDANEVEFLVQPEPSTTIGTTTYKKGSSFTLGLSLTFGSVKPENVTSVLSWANTLLGGLSFGYKYESSATQELPDQSVEMSTAPGNSALHYSFVTNNDTGGYTTSDIPALFRSDQTASFSWVWHLKKGNYCAKDNDFGNMKMRATVHPKYKTAYNGKIVDTYGRALFKGWASYQHEDLSVELDMPAINRIPAGDIKLKFATVSSNNYLTDLKVYRTGESRTAKEPYYSDPQTYCRNELITIPLRVGTYDILYEVINGTSGKTVSNGMISAVEVAEDKSTEIFTPF